MKEKDVGKEKGEGLCRRMLRIWAYRGEEKMWRVKRSKTKRILKRSRG